MKKLLTILLIATTILASAQISTAQNAKGSTNISDGYKIKTKQLKGHPYIQNEWTKGYVVDLNGKLTEEKLLNYDIYNNRLTFKMEDGSNNIMIVQDAPYSGFILTFKDKNELLFTKLEGTKFLKSKKHTKYYQIAKAPSKKVIIENSKVLKDPNASGWSSSRKNTKAAEYVQSEKIYVLNKNNKYVKIKLSKSSVLKTFKDKKKELSAYLKKNSISIKKPEHLVQIIDYYHSLQ